MGKHVKETRVELVAKLELEVSRADASGNSDLAETLSEAASAVRLLKYLEKYTA